MRRAFSLLVMAMVAGGLVVLWPTALGGTLSYVVVHGNSMVPTLHNGDLVIARSQDRYGAGEVVAYHVPQGQIGAGQLVIHRIVRVAGSVLTLRGDNNPTSDPWQPRSSDVAGAAVVHVPKLGGMLLALRTPWVAGIIGALLAIWLVTGREREHEADGPPDRPPPAADPSAEESTAELLAGFEPPRRPERFGEEPGTAPVDGHAARVH